MPDDVANNLSVYMHFPWCERRCPYCDFVTYSAAKDSIPQQRYTDALIRELEERVKTVNASRLCSIFLGGGTPSLWDPLQVGRVIAKIHELFATHAPDVEVTIECNPSSFDDSLCSALHAAGVTRVSLGVQSLSDEHLRFLGRLHSAADALNALQIATRRFKSVNADFIFGMPAQSPVRFAQEISTVVDVGVGHLSIYALTIEKNTPFGKLAQKGLLQTASEDLYVDLYACAEKVLSGQSYSHYEVSNYALPGQESIHNSHYWRGGDYLGIGVGAVGKVQAQENAATRWRNTSHVEKYLNWSELKQISEETEALDAQTQMREFLMLGLRTAQGCDVQNIQRTTGLDPLSQRRSEIALEMERGNLLLEQPWLRIPHSRWLYADSIVRSLF